MPNIIFMYQIVKNVDFMLLLTIFKSLNNLFIFIFKTILSKYLHDLKKNWNNCTIISIVLRYFINIYSGCTEESENN